MKPIDYLAKVESTVFALFQAIAAADEKAAAEHKVLSPMFDYYSYEFERWSHIEEYDDERLNYVHSRAAEAREALLLINTASAAASGAILQISKQCISMAWPKNIRLTKGRLIGSQRLSEIIWYARNQALHFETGNLNKDTKQSIELLGQEFGLDLAGLDHNPRSLARDVISLLGWKNYEIFAREMVDLLEEP
ncbi:hypothetical protein [Methylomagnum sp.]